MMGNRQLILGVDRLDYTKGIPDRVRAYERLLEFTEEQPDGSRRYRTMLDTPLSEESQAEGYWTDRDGHEGNTKSFGGFALAQYQPTRNVFLGVRLDYAEPPARPRPDVDQPAAGAERRLDQIDHARDALILLQRVDEPSAYGIAELRGERVVQLLEKPAQPRSDLALVGVYLFTPAVFGSIRNITYSARGELEITEAIQGLIDVGHTVIGGTGFCAQLTGEPEIAPVGGICVHPGTVLRR